MFTRLKKLLFDKDIAKAATASHAPNDRDIVTALLIQTALIDGHFADEERAAIIDILMRDHGASEAEAAALLSESEAKVRKSSQMFKLTTTINDSFDLDAKISLLETLWGLTLADRVITKHESNLMRRLAGLLHVPHRDNAEARQRVIDRFERGEG